MAYSLWCSGTVSKSSEPIGLLYFQVCSYWSQYVSSLEPRDSGSVWFSKLKTWFITRYLRWVAWLAACSFWSSCWGPVCHLINIVAATMIGCSVWRHSSKPKYVQLRTIKSGMSTLKLVVGSTTLCRHSWCATALSGKCSTGTAFWNQRDWTLDPKSWLLPPPSTSFLNVTVTPIFIPSHSFNLRSMFPYINIYSRNDQKNHKDFISTSVQYWGNMENSLLSLAAGNNLSHWINDVNAKIIS